ncbi:MAG: histidine kinase dimerization/phosphoacceptor domain -containing protein [Phenylobacterium sp.]
MAARSLAYSDEDAALSLTMAVVMGSPAPLLLLDGRLRIVAASASFCGSFEIDPATVRGQELFAVGGGEWNVPQLRSLLAATASGAAQIEAYEMDLKRPGRDPRRLVVQAQRLAYLDLEELRLLVAVTDVTDARADERFKTNILHENRILLQEVRHRVANSLQIIASVLMQNARKTPSDETRLHLKEAHNRVMSVAALERHLAAAAEGDEDVRMHAYLTKLCESIGASMIGDPDQISLVVEGGDSLLPARVSVSLGLIVTELVINALKHAFPDDRRGRITVDFEVAGPDWTLCVSDDGVGPPADIRNRHLGLGTSIVLALAQQVKATVDMTRLDPGTSICLKHVQIAA